MNTNDFIQVRLGELNMGLGYQRPVNNRVVNTIVIEYDPRKLDPIKLSYREDKYYVFDGQHRVRVSNCEVQY